MCERELFESTYQPIPGGDNKFMKTGKVLARRMSRDFTAGSSKGEQRGKAGDYLVQDSGGEQWSIDDKTFNDTCVSLARGPAREGEMCADADVPCLAPPRRAPADTRRWASSRRRASWKACCRSAPCQRE